jgi:hypothetical protein
VIEFNKQEQQVLKQLFMAMKLENNKTVADEILGLDNVPYAQNFKSGFGQVRLKSSEWRVFRTKLQAICEGEHHHSFCDLYDIGGEG